MSIQLRWLAVESASCFHATAAICQNRSFVDRQVISAIQASVSGLQHEIVTEDLPLDIFLQHLIPLASCIESNHELAKMVLTKTLPINSFNSSRIDSLARRISEIENEFHQALPNLVEQLELRFQPLRDSWEARGPGMLNVVSQLTDPLVIAPNADVFLVHPVLGGAGQAHLDYNSVRIEAVLADPHEKLPETVRLCWILSQLNLDVPILSETISSYRLPLVAQLSMIPIVLNAAERADLVIFDESTIRLALQAWHVGAEAERASYSNLILDWWDTYDTSRPPWSVALKALERMIYPDENSTDLSGIRASLGLG